MKHKVMTVIVSLMMMTMATGCREADRVSHSMNISADNFNITRKITVFNTRTDTILFEMTGLMSIGNTETNELKVIVEVAENQYKKHYIYLSQDTTYVVEDVSGSYEDKYYYKLNINPLLAVPLIEPVFEE
mgnify:CR=1 FL=1